MHSFLELCFIDTSYNSKQFIFWWFCIWTLFATSDAAANYDGYCGRFTCDKRPCTDCGQGFFNICFTVVVSGREEEERNWSLGENKARLKLYVCELARTWLWASYLVGGWLQGCCKFGVVSSVLVAEGQRWVSDERSHSWCIWWEYILWDWKETSTE